jgi:hypothetical protein
MILTIQELVSGSVSGLQHKVKFAHGGHLMQSDYELIGLGETRRAFSNRGLRVPLSSIKYAVRVSGGGWQKPGLDGVDFKKSVRVGFIEPMCQQTTGAAITPVRTSRSDVSPYAFAVMPSGLLVKTTLSGWAPVAVSGASYYLVYFYPLLDGDAKFSGSFDQAGGSYNWTLDFQEK